MINRLKIWLVLLVLSIMIACEESINLELPLGQERVVISGWITDNPEPYEVKVSKTVSFNDQETNPNISGAEVYVLDHNFVRYDFEETHLKGIYRSDPNELVGIPGYGYTLHVRLPDGTKFTSLRERLNPVPKLDTVFFGTSFDPILPISDPEAKVFFVRGSVMDIADTKNFFRWKLYVNDTLRDNPEELVIFDDKFTDGNTFETKVTDILLRKGDTLRLEHWSLSERAFDYYSLLISQIFEDQIGPSTPPSPVKGNISNDSEPSELVLGFFGASQIEVKTAVVTD
ncbi:MAG: DUF4249 domain-containing protein [Cyclobacteriaceae bacterium]